MTALSTHELPSITRTISRAYTFDIGDGQRAIITFISIDPHTLNPIKPINKEIIQALARLIHHHQKGDLFNSRETEDATRTNSREFHIQRGRKQLSIITIAIIPDGHLGPRKPEDHEIEGALIAISNTHVNNFTR